jgi:hypothetical protein
LNHKNTTTAVLDEIASSTTKNLAMDSKTSRQSSTSSNNLLKPDSNLWSSNTTDVEALRTKSQSLTNIAGKLFRKKKSNK